MSRVLTDRAEDRMEILQTIGGNPEVVEPFGNYIVIEMLKAEKKTAGGLELPDELVARDKQFLARAVKVGPGQKSINGNVLPCFTQEGDLVIVLKHAPLEIKLGNKSFHVVAEGDIVGRINEAQLELLLTAAKDAQVTAVEATPAPEGKDPAQGEIARMGEITQETEDATVAELPSGLVIVKSKG